MLTKEVLASPKAESFSVIMSRKRRRPSATEVSKAFLLCLALAGLFVTGCDNPTASNSTKSDDSTQPAGPFLRAEPNPIEKGNPDGKTTIYWDTGGSEVGEVYVIEADKEKHFATGPNGSQEATSLSPGTTEFRLYTQANRKLIAQLKVRMSPGAEPPASLQLNPSSPAP